MINLNGRTVFITGSTQGVGQAIAMACAEAGATVVMHGLEQNRVSENALAAVQRIQPSARLVTGNLVGEEDRAIEAIFEQALKANAKIDLLVNNAGTYIDLPFLEMDYVTFDTTMRLNVYAHFFMTQRFARHWSAQGVDGNVLMIGSINGRLAEPTHAAYDTSKGAVEMMVKTLCVELAPHNIRVNGLAPGLFVTPLTAEALADPALRGWMEQHTPNRQVPGPEVCGDAAVYLLSDAARHVTGQMLLIDGGMSAWQQPDPE